MDNSSFDEKELFQEYHETKDIAIRDKIIIKNIYLVEVLAKKYVGRGVDYDDLYQIGALALIKAIERFDWNLGIKFSTFATPSIVGEIKNYFRDKSRLIKISRKDIKIHYIIKKATNELSVKLDRMPTAREIAEYLNYSVEEVIKVLDGSITFVSLDSSVNDEMPQPLYEIIPDDKNLFEEFENKDFYNSCLELLNNNEKKLVELRFERRKSQMETAKELGVSQMFVSRLEKKILDKLRVKFDE